MTIDDLSRELRSRCERAEPNEKVTAMHIFAIAFADQLKTSSVRQVVDGAGIGKSFVSEIYKGMKLARYVTLKDT